MNWLAWAIVSLRRGAWAPCVVFAVHLVGMFAWDVYSEFPDFDVPMHFAGGVAIAYFFGACFRTAEQSDLLGRPSGIVFPVTIIGLTSLAAVVWELAEFATDRLMGTHTQPGLPDTMLDLVMGILGGIVWIAWDRAGSKHNS